MGAIELVAGHCKTVLEILHAVPGLDSVDPQTVAVLDEFSYASDKRQILVLSPVSLVLVKLHALRHFPQEDRQDLVHLKVSLAASKVFISEILRESTPQGSLELPPADRPASP